MALDALRAVAGALVLDSEIPTEAGEARPAQARPALSGRAGTIGLRLLGTRPRAHDGVAQVVLVPGGNLRVQPGSLHVVALALVRDGRVEEIVRTLRVGLREVSQG